MRRTTFLAALLFGCAPVFADFRLVHCSDTHFGAGNNQQADVAMFKEISSLDPRPAFVVNTGDVAEIGTDEEYAQLQDALKFLTPKMYIAPGNHDVRWNPRGKEGFTRGTSGPLYQSWDYGGVHFVALDSTVLLQHWGHISQDQLDWLKADLESVGKDTPVVIGFHHWIGREKVMVDNEQTLMDLVAPYNVVLWLQGHGHSDIQWNINGAPAIMQKGLYQGSYTVIDVTGGKMTLRRRSLVDPKKRKRNELVRDKSVPASEEVEWEDVMTIPLHKQPAPRWAAEARPVNGSINIVAHRGDLPSDATLQARLNDGEFVPMQAHGDAWTCEMPAAPLAPGNHIVTVQAVLADGRAYQRPVSVKIAGAIAPVWETNIGGAVQARLVRDGELLYLPSMGGDLVALRAENGAEVFRVRTEGPVYATPHVENGVVYFTSADHHIYAADAKTGALKWKTRTGGAVLGGAALAQGVVCAGSVDTKIYGVDAATGEIRWTVDGNNMYQSKPATDGTHFFVGGWDNRFRCIDAATGKEKWALKLGKSARNDSFSAFSPAITSPAIGEGLVFISTNDGILHALRIEDGSEAWRIDWQKMGYSSPLYHDGRVYCALSDEGKVFCADAKTGAMLWTAETGSVIYDSSFCYSEGIVFIGCVDGTFSAIRADDGKRLWQYRLGPGHVLASPAADGRNVYISSMSGKVTALPTRQ